MKKKIGIISIAMAVLLVAGTIGFASAQSFEATRTIDKDSVAPGGTFEVDVVVTLGDVDGLILQEDLPNNWDITEQTSAADFSEPSSWLWFSATIDQDTVTYTVQVPDDATETDYDITGELLVSGSDETATVTGDNTITVEEDEGGYEPPEPGTVLAAYKNHVKGLLE